MPHTVYVGARSPFVTVIGWLTLAVVMLTAGDVLRRESLLAFAFGGPLHGAAEWMTAAPQRLWVASALAAVALLVVIAAAGLLLRQDWARRLFIALLALLAIAHLPGLWLQYRIVQGLAGEALHGAGPLPPAAADLLHGTLLATQAMGALLALAVCALLVWIMRRLMSPAVRQEFA